MLKGDDYMKKNKIIRLWTLSLALTLILTTAAPYRGKCQRSDEKNRHALCRTEKENINQDGKGKENKGKKQ